MPLPKKHKGETLKEFVARAMGNSVMNKEFPKQDQRYAVVRSLAKRVAKKKKG